MEIGKLAVRKFGKRLREIRQDKGISQMELGDRINVTATYIGRIERGERSPSLPTIARLAHALSVSVADLCQEI
jgi:transcriptional regulator with XRE-family HTH domain